MSRNVIPNNVISVVGDVLGQWYYSHTKLNTLFAESGAPGDPPEGNCVTKCQTWLKRANNDSTVDSFDLLEQVLAPFISLEKYDDPQWKQFYDRIQNALSKHNLEFDVRGVISQIVPAANTHSSSYDVFMSHNTKDKSSVRELGETLKRRGLTVWLDEWELVPGRPWQEALEQIIKTAKSAVVLIGNDGLGPWELPEMRACLDQFVKRKLPVIPILLPNAPKQPDLPLFMQAFTWVDLRRGLTAEGLDLVVWGITGIKPNVRNTGNVATTPSLKNLTWYTLDVFHCRAVTTLTSDPAYRDACNTLGERLRAACAKTSLTTWDADHEQIGNAVRAWLASTRNLTASEAGRMSVEMIIELLSTESSAESAVLHAPQKFVGAIAIWQEKLEGLFEAEAIAFDAAQKFALKKQIEEARLKIRELGG